VIALIVTPEGFPLTYEVMAGNTADNTTLPKFLQKIETRYGKAQRVWVMDRGIPTEEHLAEMRRRGAYYLVGTPKGRLSKLEQELAARPWQQARPEVRVKLLAQQGDLYVYVQSEARIDKERAMRRKKLKWLWWQCSCSTCTFRPPMRASSSSPATPSLKPISSSCSRNWAGHCHRRLRPKSPLQK
jgi:Transposase DDE domain